MSDSQKEEWEAFVKASHARGKCEFSGMGIVTCQSTICDCFETPEGAKAIERKAGIR